jgi:restriction endonuclease S subunit
MDKDTKAPSLEFLIALINSTFFSWIFSKTANKLVTDTFPRISLHDLKNFSIRIPGKKEEDEIVSIVNAIYLQKKNDHNINTSALENKLDDLIYKLYDLSMDEIEIVEEI